MKRILLLLLLSIFAFGCSGDGITSTNDNNYQIDDGNNDDGGDKKRPVARFVGLETGMKVSGKTTINVLANSGYDISEVSLFIDKELIETKFNNTDDLYEFEVDFNLLEAGNHYIKVEVKDEERYEATDEISVASEIDWAPTRDAKIKISVDSFSKPHCDFWLHLWIEYYLDGEKELTGKTIDASPSSNYPVSHIFDIPDNADSLRFAVKTYYYKDTWFGLSREEVELDYTPDSGSYYIHEINLLYLYSGRYNTSFSYSSVYSIRYSIELIEE